MRNIPMRHVLLVPILVSSAFLVATIPAEARQAPTPDQGEIKLGAEFRHEGDHIKASCSSGFSAVFKCPMEFLTDHPVHMAVGSLAPQNGFRLRAGLCHTPVDIGRSLVQLERGRRARARRLMARRLLLPRRLYSRKASGHRRHSRNRSDADGQRQHQPSSDARRIRSDHPPSEVVVLRPWAGQPAVGSIRVRVGRNRDRIATHLPVSMDSGTEWDQAERVRRGERTNGDAEDNERGRDSGCDGRLHRRLRAGPRQSAWLRAARRGPSHQARFRRKQGAPELRAGLSAVRRAQRQSLQLPALDRRSRSRFLVLQDSPSEGRLRHARAR